MASNMQMILEVYGYLFLTVLLHEISHIPIMVFERRIQGIVFGFINGKIYNFVIGVVPKNLRYIDIVLPQILVPIILLWIRPATPILISAAICNVLGGAIDFDRLVNKYRNRHKPIMIYGVGIFFKPMRVEKGWL